MARLECCRPTAYASTMVHSPLCQTPEQPLTKEEYREWLGDGRERAAAFNAKAEAIALERAQTMARHPAGTAYNGKPRRRNLAPCTCFRPLAPVCSIHGGEL